MDLLYYKPGFNSHFYQKTYKSFKPGKNATEIDMIYCILLRCGNFTGDRSAALISLQNIYAALRYHRCAMIAALRELH